MIGFYANQGKLINESASKKVKINVHESPVQSMLLMFLWARAVLWGVPSAFSG